jgi:streptogramin lyase
MQVNQHHLSTSERLPMGLVRSVLVLALATGTVFLSGCAFTSAATDATPGAAGTSVQLSGKTFGGQQPVSGSVVNMYAVGSTGYGSASTSILNSGVSVTSDANGNFTLTNKFTCPVSNPLVYVTATGGDAGAGNNSALALMASLGPCNSLSASTLILINEVSTVAAVVPFSPFMNSATAIGTSPTNALGLTNAYGDTTLLASLSKGTSPGEAALANMTVSTTTLYTIANILAACVNSNGPSSSGCSTLFTNTTLNGVAPTDTIAAALNIAKRPGSNVAALFTLQTSTSPFQSALPAAPSDYLLTAYVPTAYSLPQNITGDSTGSVWSSSFNTITRYAPNMSTVFAMSSSSNASTVSIDQSNNAWLAQGAKISKVTPAGVLTTYAPAGVSSAYGIAVDGQGQVWYGNNTGGSIGALTQSGTQISGSPFTVPINPGDLVFSTH